jgi:hypothetical protein
MCSIACDLLDNEVFAIRVLVSIFEIAILGAASASVDISGALRFLGIRQTGIPAIHIPPHIFIFAGYMVT